MTNAEASVEMDPAQIEELRRTIKPLAEAHTLPPWCYTSESFYAAEVRQLFMQEWLGVARIDEIPNPGDYLCVDIAEQPIVVLRDRDGEIRAFTRSCRHRGACVVEGRGNTRFFRCPFHGWTYDLRGNLIAARQMDQTSGFERSEWPLLSLRVEVWEGLIFVNFDLHAEALTPRLSGASQALKNYRLSDLRASGQMGFFESMQLEACHRAGHGHVSRPRYAFHAQGVIASRQELCPRRFERRLDAVVLTTGAFASIHHRHQSESHRLPGH